MLSLTQQDSLKDREEIGIKQELWPKELSLAGKPNALMTSEV